MGDMPHVTLTKMANKYGPIMYLKMGTRKMVVASNPAAARAFLKDAGHNFANRPSNAGATHVAYNSQDVVFAKYGPKWRLMRKLCNLHLLGGKAIENWAQVRAEELDQTVQAMHRSSLVGEPVVVPEMLTYAIGNMLGQVILSRRLFDTKGRESNEFKDMVVELMTTGGYFNVGDFIPFLGWLDLQGIERGMKRLHKRFDALLTRMINEHVASNDRRKSKPDFLDAIMAYLGGDHSDADHNFTLTNIKALLLNLFAAGTDTSSSVIEWALAEMLKNPSIMNKAQQEMDQIIGHERRLQESDVSNLPYLRAICNETFRLHPSTPLNLPRVAAEPCEIAGYFIPKDTRLSVNIWAIGRDPDVWEKPLEFKPERFVSDEKNKKMDPSGNDFELIPFGAGRRICAGTRLGILMVQFILGTLVHSFDWKLPEGVSELNMEETFGLALQKKVPLTAMVSPRLSPRVYTL
ncbi:flavonoid 3',5'-hydroxylase 2-like [Prosopis cineraria]|uniref:flavonoid 3',5'-hydroxylase 2-like n=1 Tax=Prosopis cineraria TaxID=364024 RepID=UPI00241088BE|nr:flavonoid 3',5'-hydroxylase 2-like [Prosopis cineraria]